MATLNTNVEKVTVRKGESLTVKVGRKVIVLHGDGTTEIWKDNGRVFDRDGKL